VLDHNALADKYKGSPLVTLKPNNGNPVLNVNIDKAEGVAILNEILDQVCACTRARR
jgi:hypothetical protein